MAKKNRAPIEGEQLNTTAPSGATAENEVVNTEVMSDTTASTAETPISQTPAEPTMVPLSDVKKMIADEIAKHEANKSLITKPKKVTEHTAHLWRFDGKWVVDFKNMNTDPYVKENIHAYNKFNELRREFEAWITLVFHDGSEKEVPLVKYLQRRTPVYCPILKRHKEDMSYSIGEVEKMKEVGDKLVPSGVMVDQEVTMYKETFEIKSPEGLVFVLPDYVIA